MRIDLSGIEIDTEDRLYVKREGVITLKVVKITHFTTKNGNQAFKVHFKTRANEWAFDEFILTDNALWRLKILTKALKLPNAIDTDMMLNRYVKATFVSKVTQNGNKIFEIKKYEPSELTNTYEIPVHYERTSNVNIQEEIIEDDKIPF